MRRRVNVRAELRRPGKARRKLGRRLAVIYSDFLDEYPNQRNQLIRDRSKN